MPDLFRSGPAWPAFLAVAVIAAAVAWQLMTPPPVGLADNGDFPRVMSRFNIGYLSDKYEDRYFLHFLSTYRIAAKDYWDSHFATSQVLIVALAMPVNRLISEPGFFDVRSVALIHLLLELAAAWLLLEFAPVEGTARAVLFAIVVLALTEVGYVCYFNSFYSEPGTFVFLLLALGAVLTLFCRPGAAALLGFCAASLLFLLSKPQNFAPGIVLGALAARFCALRDGAPWRWACAGVSIGLISASAYYYTLKPDDVITVPSHYLSVFNAILPYSPAPRQDLTELGLDPDFARYSGTSPFTVDSPRYDPEFQRAFFSRMSFSKVILFHLRHPIRFLGVLDRCVRNSPSLRPLSTRFPNDTEPLGNYEKSSGRPAFAISQSFHWWGRLRQTCAPGSAWSFALFFGANFAGCAVLYRRRRAARDRLWIDLQVALLLMALTQWFSVAIAQGTYEAVKHLFLFDMLIDICFTIAVVWLVSAAAGEAALIFLGFLSLLQITVLPGCLCLRALRLPTRGILQTATYTFALSLLANYILVYALSSAHVYTTPVFYWVLLLEAAAYSSLLSPSKHFPTRLPQSPSPPVARALVPAASRLVSTLFSTRDWLAALPALAAILGLAWLCYWNWGSVFTRGDDVVSWDRWAVEWYENRLSHGTGYYPQLLPVNWSIPYVVMQNIDIKMFGKAIMPLFSLGIGLLLLDLFQKTGEAAWLWGLSCYAVLLNYLLAPDFIASGYVEMANAFFAFLTYYACLQAAESPPGPSPRALLLVVAFASGTLLVKQGGVYIFIWALCWLVVQFVRRAPGTSWRLAVSALLLALALNWWYVMRQWDMLRGLDANNLVYLTRDIHAGRTYSQRWTYSLHMLENVRGGGLEHLFWLAAALTLLSVFHRRGRIVLLTIAAPFYILWAFLFSYEVRTLAMDLPFLGFCCGCGLDVVFGLGARAILKMPGKAMRSGLAALAVLLMGALAAWVIVPAVGPMANPEFNGIVRDSLLAAIFFMPVLVLTWKYIRFPVSVPRALVFAVFCGIAVVPAAVLDPDWLIRDQLEKRQQAGFPPVNRKIEDFTAAHPLEGMILTDYWFLDCIPGLRVHVVASMMPPAFEPSSLQEYAGRPGVRYVLTSSRRFPRSTRDWMEHHGFETLLTESGLEFVRFPR